MVGGIEGAAVQQGLTARRHIGVRQVLQVDQRYLHGGGGGRLLAAADRVPVRPGVPHGVGISGCRERATMVYPGVCLIWAAVQIYDDVEVFMYTRGSLIASITEC